MADRLAERERLLSLGSMGLADYALSLEARIAELQEEKGMAESCPYPLHREKSGLSHRRIVATVPDEHGEPVVVVQRCEACGRVELAMNVPVAG